MIVQSTMKSHKKNAIIFSLGALGRINFVVVSTVRTPGALVRPPGCLSSCPPITLIRKLQFQLLVDWFPTWTNGLQPTLFHVHIYVIYLAHIGPTMSLKTCCLQRIHDNIFLVMLIREQKLVAPPKICCEKWVNHQHTNHTRKIVIATIDVIYRHTHDGANTARIHWPY